MIFLTVRDQTLVSSWSKLLLRTFLCAVMIADAKAQQTSFPGEKSETRSPDGQYIISNVDDATREPAHTLTLSNTRNGAIIKTYSYGRHVDVLWSPSSSAFVVNDYEGSDSTRPLLYIFPWSGQKTDLLEELKKLLHRRHQEKLVLTNDHVYLTAQRWISPRELLCQLEAYGDASRHGAGFKGYYIYKIDSGFRVYDPNAPVD